MNRDRAQNAAWYRAMLDFDTALISLESAVKGLRAAGAEDLAYDMENEVSRLREAQAKIENGEV